MNAPYIAMPIVLRNLISVKEAARYSGYSVQYLRRLLRSGGVGGLKIGQLWLIEMNGFSNLLGKMTKDGEKRFGPRKRFLRRQID